VNNYSIYLHDIKPKGFKVIEIDDYIKEDTVSDVIEVLRNKSMVKEMVEFNYNLAKRFYSYANLRRKLRFILTDFFGEEWYGQLLVLKTAWLMETCAMKIGYVSTHLPQQCGIATCGDYFIQNIGVFRHLHLLPILERGNKD
jgi:hypothetical protein